MKRSKLIIEVKFNGATLSSIEIECPKGFECKTAKITCDTLKKSCEETWIAVAEAMSSSRWYLRN